MSLDLARGAFHDARDEIDRGIDAARVPSQMPQDKSAATDYLPTHDTVSLLTWKAELRVRLADGEKDQPVKIALLREAVDTFLAAERVFDLLRGSMPGEGDRLLAGDQAPEFPSGLMSAYLRIIQTDPSSADPNTLFATAERSTARSLLATLGEDIAARIGGVSEEDRAHEHRLLVARDTAMKRFLRLPYDEKATQMSPQQLEAWKGYQKSMREFSEYYNRPGTKVPGRLGAGVPACASKQAIELLDANEVAVSFVLGSRESFAVILARENNQPSVTLRRLPSAGELDERVTALIEPGVLESTLVMPAAEALYDFLLGPIADRIAGRDLLIVPTGALCRLPFELLREPGPNGRQYLGEVRTIRYAPSLTVLRMLRERGRLLKDRPDRAFWAMADPLDTAVPGQPLDPTSLPPLPRAAAEATNIARLLGGDDASVLIGRDATRSAAMKASEDARCGVIDSSISPSTPPWKTRNVHSPDSFSRGHPVTMVTLTQRTSLTWT